MRQELLDRLEAVRKAVEEDRWEDAYTLAMDAAWLAKHIRDNLWKLKAIDKIPG